MKNDRCKRQEVDCGQSGGLHTLGHRDCRFPLVVLYFACFILHFSFCILSPASAAEAKKVVIPFDFVSKFDDGHYGQLVGDMLWKKLSREKQFVLPESMTDVRDYCTAHHLKPSPETDLEQMRKIVQRDFDAQIGIWGSVERAPGAEQEIYDLVIKCVDFSEQPTPKVIYQIKTRTHSVGEIPHLYVKRMFDALCGRPATRPALPDSIADDNWQKHPNLVRGDFEHGGGGVPAGWEKTAGQQHESLGGLVRWTAEEGNPANKVVRFTLDANVAANEGVMYYSDYFPVEEGAKYRFQCRWRSDGPTVKVFIKCYDEEATAYQAEASDSQTSSVSRNSPRGKMATAPAGQRREVYRSQQNLKGPPNTWNMHTEDFTPRHVKYSPKWGRVMLYAYLNPGTVEFDDVVVKQIVAPPPDVQAKVRRHSLETKITIKEMEENERRSQKVKDTEK
jgi:hypothetical protein